MKQDQWNIIPDGIYTRADGKQIRIEVENSYKGRDRMRFLVRKLRDSFEKFDLLLYVATTSSIYDRLIQCFTGFDQMPIAVIKWDDLRSNPDPTVWSAKGMRYIFPQPVAPKEQDSTEEVSQ